MYTRTSNYNRFRFSVELLKILSTYISVSYTKITYAGSRRSSVNTGEVGTSSFRLRRPLDSFLTLSPCKHPFHLRKIIMSQGRANPNDSTEAVQEPDQEAPKKAKSRRPASKTTRPSSSICSFSWLKLITNAVISRYRLPATAIESLAVGTSPSSQLSLRLN